MPDDKPRLFWDSSAFIGAIMFTDPRSAIRQLMQLGEFGLLDMRVSRDVIRETEAIVRGRNPSLLPAVAQAIVTANMATTLDPAEETIDLCEGMTGYRPDARVLAAAIECDADIFVTHDAQHFLGNPLIGPPDTRLRVMTPAECLRWCSEQLQNANTAEEPRRRNGSNAEA